MGQTTRAALTLFSREGCHLCDEMKAVIEDVARQIPLDLQIVDIDTDPELVRRYGEEIPVLLIDGRKAAKYRITREELDRKIGGRT